MCGTCGCSNTNQVTMTNMDDHKETVLSGTGSVVENHGSEPTHSHESHHSHVHHHGEGIPHFHDSEGKVVTLEEAVLAKNDRLAAMNREWLDGRQVVALNLISSPGAGKTALLEKTLKHLQGISVMVIEGDQNTTNDAQRIKQAGAKTVQINTGTGCHLEADMVGKAIKELQPSPGTLLFIENVGNLVCPAMFDLGESKKVVVISVTEGEDKPIKYPHIFRACELVVINKVDLIPHLEFDLDLLKKNVYSVNPKAQIITTSVTKDEIKNWLDFLMGLLKK